MAEASVGGGDYGAGGVGRRQVRRWRLGVAGVVRRQWLVRVGVRKEKKTEEEEEVEKKKK